MNEFKDYIEYRTAMILWKSFPPFCLLIGTFGNVLTIIILMQRKNRYSSTAIYLTALAASDLLVLWTGLLKQWILYTFDTDLMTLSRFWCKSRLFLVYTGFQCSSWFLVAVTSERFISVWFPHQVKLVCNPRNSCIVILVIIGCLVILNVHWYYGYSFISHSIDNETDLLLCGPIDDGNYVKFLDIWEWIDLCLVSLIPVSLLSIANISIIFFIIKRKRIKHNRIAPSVETSYDGRRVPQLTVTLMTVSMVFVVCSIPISIFLIKSPYETGAKMTSQDRATDELWWAVVNLLVYLNTTLNFVLYFLSGPRFRQEVKTFFSRERSSAVSSETHLARPRIFSTPRD